MRYPRKTSKASTLRPRNHSEHFSPLSVTLKPEGLPLALKWRVLSFVLINTTRSDLKSHKVVLPSQARVNEITVMRERHVYEQQIAGAVVVGQMIYRNHSISPLLFVLFVVHAYRKHQSRKHELNETGRL